MGWYGNDDDILDKYIELQDKYINLMREYNYLVGRINAKGGEQFLHRGKLPEEFTPQQAQPQFSLEEIERLIRLCHPNKHMANASQERAANEITAKLLIVRKTVKKL